MAAAAYLAVSSASADDAPGIPPAARWRAASTNFFFQLNGTGWEIFKDPFYWAMQAWHPGNFSFQLTGDATGNMPCRPRPPNLPIVNVVMVSSTVCGGNFGTDALAVTSTYTDAQGALVAADITFNTAFRFGLYNGPSRPGVYDFSRVAVHELGHAAGLNHSTDINSIMYPIIGTPELPNALDQANMKAKYDLTPPPLPPDAFLCPVSIPFAEVVPLGDLTSSTYQLGRCLDAKHPNTTFTFRLPKARDVDITITADVSELNVFLKKGLAEYPWRAENDGTLEKTSPLLKLTPGDYALTVFPAKYGSTYRVAWILH